MTEKETKAIIKSKIEDLQEYKKYVKEIMLEDIYQVKLIGKYSGATLSIREDLSPISTEIFIKGYIELIDREIDKLECEYAFTSGLNGD